MSMRVCLKKRNPLTAKIAKILRKDRKVPPRWLPIAIGSGAIEMNIMVLTLCALRLNKYYYQP
jgi:hypothetical protein